MFCTNMHYQQFEHETKSTHLMWKNDGKEGKNDPNTSAYLLVNWLANIDYTQWRGSINIQNTFGMKKIEIATCIYQMINNH